MQWKALTPRLHRHAFFLSRTFSSTSLRSNFQQVQRLPSWDLDGFRQKAFHANLPAQLPSKTAESSRVRHDWFKHDQPTIHKELAHYWSLNQDFWARYKATVVPLELTATSKDGTSRFERMQAPLSLFLEWMKQATENSSQRLYLAQCQLADLPAGLRDQLPTPELVLRAGKGDIYDSNLWMGLAPTYTPLHRDPNPNLFLQLAGRKVVRLFPPDVGVLIFEDAQENLGRSSSSIFRGDEMMHGEEKELLEQEVWQRVDGDRVGYETTLDHGEALFIPLGWWHSIKGVGKGVTASVNWWFR